MSSIQEKIKIEETNIIRVKIKDVPELTGAYLVKHIESKVKASS